MKCLNCGTENPENSTFCSTCGNAMTPQNNNTNFSSFDPNQMPNSGTIDMNQFGQPANNYQQPMNNYQQPMNNQGGNSEEGANVGLCILSFLIPIVGIVLFFTNSDKPKARKPYLICALIPMAISMLSTIALILGASACTFTVNSGLDNDFDDYDITTTTTTKKATKSYSLGDPVTLLDGSEWHVLTSDGTTVTLMSDTLALSQSGYGKDSTEASQQYENSSVKEYLEGTYLPALKVSLDAKGGDTSNLSARLLTLNEFFTYSKYDNNSWYNNECYTSISTKDSKSFYYIDKEFVVRNSDYTGYEDSLTSQEKFDAMLVLTKSFWLGSSVKDRVGCVQPSSITYYGAYYIKNSSDINAGGYNYPSYMVSSDMEAVTGNATGQFLGDNTIVGVRPLIETSIKNIK